MEYYFCLEFFVHIPSYSHGFYMFSNIVHFLTYCNKPHENRSGESRITACQTLWGSKSKVAETHFPGRWIALIAYV